MLRCLLSATVLLSATAHCPDLLRRALPTHGSMGGCGEARLKSPISCNPRAHTPGAALLDNLLGQPSPRHVAPDAGSRGGAGRHGIARLHRHPLLPATGRTPALQAMSRTRPVWPASAAARLQAAGWPRLAGAWGSPRHDLALRRASGEPAGRGPNHLCFGIGS